MNEPIIFEIPGNPKALKRHRRAKRKGKIITYDPSSNDKLNFAKQAKQYAPDEPFNCPIYVKILFWLKRPRIHYRTGKYSDCIKQNAPLYHTNRPDIDNMVKFVADSLNGIFWKDDSIICRLDTLKAYTDETPSTEIVIREIK